MARLTIYFFFAATLVMVPFYASAMDVLSDSEMDAVTARTGVDIRVIDVLLDLEIMNSAWGDTDCGTLMVSGMPVAYSQGYINISRIKVRNLYMTMNTGNHALMTRRTAADPSSLDTTPLVQGVLVQHIAYPATIDIFAGGTGSRENSF